MSSDEDVVIFMWYTLQHLEENDKKNYGFTRLIKNVSLIV